MVWDQEQMEDIFSDERKNSDWVVIVLKKILDDDEELMGKIKVQKDRRCLIQCAQTSFKTPRNKYSTRESASEKVDCKNSWDQALPYFMLP